MSTYNPLSLLPITLANRQWCQQMQMLRKLILEAGVIGNIINFMFNDKYICLQFYSRATSFTCKLWIFFQKILDITKKSQRENFKITQIKFMEI